MFNILVLSFYAFFKNGLIALTAYYFLFKLWYPIWNEKIWPNIQTPIVGVLADWTTLDPQIPDYEISVNLISEKLGTLLARVESIRKRRRESYAFLFYASLTGLFGIILGQKISGFYLFYTIVITLTSIPMIFRDEILGTIRKLEREANISIRIENMKNLRSQTSSESKPLFRKLDSEIEEQDALDNIPTYSESESSDEPSTEEDIRDEDSPDPNPEPTWMEDFTYNPLTRMPNTLSTVKTQIEEAISSKFGTNESNGTESSGSEEVDFVVLSKEDAK